METKTQLQDRIIEELIYPVHGLLKIAPRVGKTRITIEIIKKMNPKTILWITPSVKLRDVDIPEEFKTWDAENFLKKVKIICYSSLAKQKGPFELIILDEYQSITVKNTAPLFNGKIKYTSIIGLSGTHPKHLVKKMLLAALNLPILKTISIDDAIEANLIADYTVTTISVPLEDTKKIIKAGSKKRPFYTTERANYKYLTGQINTLKSTGQIPSKFLYLKRMRALYESPQKNLKARELVSKLTGRTIVFSATIQLAEQMSPYTYHSKSTREHLDNFLAKKIALLSCVNAGGLGFTYQDIDNIVLVQTNRNLAGQPVQKLARGLMKRPGYTANIYIFYIPETEDEMWKDEVLKDLNTKSQINIKL